MPKAIIIAATVALLTILPAIIHGQYSNRWGEQLDLTIATQRLQEFPKNIGLWQCASSDDRLGEVACRELGLAGHFIRDYVHSETGETVNLLLMLGPPGRLVRHPPEVCYANRANQQVGEITSLEIKGESKAHQFKVVHYQHVASPGKTEFFVTYAHSSDGSWATPYSPRLEFGGEPKLYKVQILSERAALGDSGMLEGFLNEFVLAFPIVLVNDPPKSDESQFP